MNEELIAIIILTYNEELHIERAIKSAKKVSSNIIIVDSYSTDRTKAICDNLNVRYFNNKFIDHASQLNWALNNINITVKWIIRLDADEYFTDELIKELNLKIKSIDESISGIYFKRRVYFMGKWIKHGGYYPTRLLRMWRNGFGEFEQRAMDEHFILSKGETIVMLHDIIDENRNDLSWWINKHNNYASKEVNSILGGKEKSKTLKSKFDKTKSDATKRWYKENIYMRLPIFFRAFLYFSFRYFVRLGFIDGTPGLIWHFLQGFWYRFLVDAKLYERNIKKNK